VIDGVRITPLRRIPDERGAILHMLRADDEHFVAFGEIYFSMVNPGVVKGWHLHRRMTLNYAVPVGTITLALYDDRAASPTHGEVAELRLGGDNYALVTIPPLVWNGFRGEGDAPSFVANCATIPHDPDEIVRLDPYSADIPYQWPR
jgi:dTDP-4-dehydrorhamnose 3,5-epimerase